MAEKLNVARQDGQASAGKLRSDRQEEDLAIVTYLSIKILPVIQEALQKTSEELMMLISAMKNPFQENYSVVNTYVSDGDLYFHYNGSDKWKNKILRFQPELGRVCEIYLPEINYIKCSRIF